MTKNGTHSDVLLFDDRELRKISAAEMSDVYQWSNQLNFRKLGEVFSRVVAQCPSAWGDPKEAKTYSQRPVLTDGKRVLKEFQAALNDINLEDDDAELAVRYDFNKLTGEESTDFFEAFRQNNLVKMSGVLAHIVVECPETWGKPDDPATYSQRAYVDFVRLANQFVKALNEEAKN